MPSSTQATQPSVPPISLRPITQDDLPLLQRIYASTREKELSVVPWSAEQKQAFLLMQFEAQHKYYQTHFGDARFDLILLGTEPIGRFYVGRWPSEIEVIDISLLPEWRGAGIGSQLMSGVIDESEKLGKRLGIYVEKFNPARHLYERLGFVKVEDAEVYDRMIRRPTTSVGN